MARNRLDHNERSVTLGRIVTFPEFFTISGKIAASFLGHDKPSISVSAIHGTHRGTSGDSASVAKTRSEH